MEIAIILLMITHFFVVMLKLVDMSVFGTIYNVTVGKNIADRFHKINNSKGTESALKFLVRAKYEPLKFYKALTGYIKNNNLRLAFTFYYKWPTLMLSTSAATLLLPIEPISIYALKVISTLLLSLLIVAELAHEFSARLSLGVIDNLRSYVVIDIESQSKLNKRHWNLTKVLRDFFVTISVQLFCFTVAFSSFYWHISQVDAKAFYKPIVDMFDSFYFSVTTVTTTGYGDITPQLFVSKLAVTTQMLVTWFFVVFIAGHFAMTLTESINSNPKSGKG